MEVSLLVVGGKNAGKKIPVAPPKFFIGRGEDCHLQAGSDQVSRHHAVVIVEEGFVAVRDLGSKSGTFVNQERVKTQRELKNGDRLKTGPLEFEVELAVGVGGKKKPKIQNVAEAVTRSAQAGRPLGEDDFDLADIFGEDASDDVDEASPPDRPEPASVEGQTRIDLEAAEGARPPKQRKPQKKPGLVGRFESNKPIADSSREAADQVLRELFKQKRK